MITAGVVEDAGGVEDAQVITVCGRLPPAGGSECKVKHSQAQSVDESEISTPLSTISQGQLAPDVRYRSIINIIESAEICSVLTFCIC